VLKNELEIKNLIASEPPLYQKQAEQKIARLKPLLIQHRKQIESINLFKRILLGICVGISFLYLYFLEPEYANEDNPELTGRADSLEFLVTFYMLWASITLLLIEGGTKAYKKWQEYCGTSPRLKLYQAFQDLVEGFNNFQKNKSQIERIHSSKENFDYILFTPARYVFKKQQFSPYAISKIFKDVLLRNDISIVEGGEKVIIPLNQFISLQKIENIKKNFSEQLTKILDLRAKNRETQKTYAPLYETIATVEGWKSLPNAKQEEISKWLNKDLVQPSPDSHPTFSKKIGWLSQKKKIRSLVNNREVNIKRQVIEEFTSWDKKEYDLNKLPDNMVELNAPWLPPRRHFAEFLCKANQFISEDQHRQFFLIFKRGTMVPPKGAQGFVSTDNYIKKFETGEWCHSDLKLKSPNKDGRVYCTGHSINEEGQTLHKITTFIKRTH
jgi:hypothetical protein